MQIESKTIQKQMFGPICSINSQKDPAIESIIKKSDVKLSDIQTHLILGNRAFRKHIETNDINLRELSEKESDIILYLCQDPRASLGIGIDSYINSNIAVIYNRNNAISFESSSGKINMDVLGAIGKNGQIKVQMHTNCIQNENNDDLLDYSYMQAKRVLEQIKKKQIMASVSYCLFDWENAELFYSHDKIIDLMTKIFLQRKTAGLVDFQSLQTAYAHSIIISSINDKTNRLPVDPRSIFGLERPNEAVTITANGNISSEFSGFDNEMLNSIIYSLTNYNAKMIVLLNGNEDTLVKWKSELDFWLDGLYKSNDKKEQEIGLDYIKQKIRIQSFLFDIDSAKIESI